MGTQRKKDAIDWVEICRAYDGLRKGFSSMGYGENEAGEAAANVIAAMIMANRINKVFCERMGEKEE